MVSYLSYSWRMAGKKRKITVALADKLPLIFVALKSETFHDRLRQDDGKVLATSAVGRLLAESLFFSLSLFRLISTQKNNTTNVCSEEPGIPSESRTTASTWQPSREFSWWVDGVIDGHFPNPNEMKKKTFLFSLFWNCTYRLFFYCALRPAPKFCQKLVFFSFFKLIFSSARKFMSSWLCVLRLGDSDRARYLTLRVFRLMNHPINDAIAWVAPFPSEYRQDIL